MSDDGGSNNGNNSGDNNNNNSINAISNWKYFETVALGTLLLVGLGGYYTNQQRQIKKEDVMKIAGNGGVGKVVIVTGANTGVGYATAKQLALAGASVVLACRSEVLGMDAVSTIIKETGNQNVSYKQLDLCNIESIEKFAASTQDCHVLINNAGATFKKQEFVYGIDKTMFTNYYGQFLLIKLMLPVLAATSIKSNGEEVRIVNIGSRSEKLTTLGSEHANRKINGASESSSSSSTEVPTCGLEIMTMGPQPYGLWTAYGASKFCDLVSTFELHRRINRGCYTNINPVGDYTSGNSRAGTGGSLDSRGNIKANITVNAVTPGLVNSDLSRFANPILLWLSYPLRYFALKTIDQGALGIVWVALSRDLNGVSGKYFTDLQELQSSDIAHSEVLGKDMWDESERVISKLLLKEGRK